MRRALLIALLTVGAIGGVTANDLCGTTVTGDLKLDHDLVCAGDGLIVGADGIRIDLNGHTIAGSGAGVGVLVVGRSDVTVANGVIRNFLAAVQMNTSTGIVIRHNEFVQNGEGIDVQAGTIGTIVKANVVRDNATRGIMLRGGSRDTDVKNNTFSGNRIGVLLFGAIDSEVKDNLVSGNSVSGIRFNVVATGNVVKDNVVVSNVAGVSFAVTPTGSAIGNELKGNTVSGNACGVEGPAAGNSFKDNTFQGNTVDAC